MILDFKQIIRDDINGGFKTFNQNNTPPITIFKKLPIHEINYLRIINNFT